MVTPMWYEHTYNNHKCNPRDRKNCNLYRSLQSHPLRRCNNRNNNSKAQRQNSRYLPTRSAAVSHNILTLGIDNSQIDR